MKNPFSPLAFLGRFTLGRFFLFRKELLLLWRAFRHSATPIHLKAAMLLVPLYLVSPIDLIPDFIPLAGWLDDMVIVPMLVSWIVSMLPLEARGDTAKAGNYSGQQSRPRRDYSRHNGPTIDGTARRR